MARVPLARSRVMTCTHPTLVAINGGVCPVCPSTPTQALSARVPPRNKIIAEQCRRSLARFVREAWHVLEPGNPLIWTWHLDVICDHVQAMLEDVAAAKADRSYRMRVDPNEGLVINAPPRSLKSMIVMVFAPAWAWTRWPWRTFRCLSVNPGVAKRDSRKSNELIKHAWYRESFDVDWQIGGVLEDGDGNPLPDGVELYQNSRRGFRASSGLGAQVVGSGSDVILIDDPHDPDEVLSEAKRKSVVDRYDASIHNRVDDPLAAARIAVMQRLHEDDLSGHLYREGWRGLVIRQIAEKQPDDQKRKTLREKSQLYEGTHAPTFLGWVDRRAPGELLFPERFSPEWCAKESKRLGSMRWAGQHQQNPGPGDGILFKIRHWAYYKDGDLPDRFDRITGSIDLNGKETDNGSRAACTVWGQVGSKHYLIYAWAERPGFTEAVAEIRAIVARVEERFGRITAMLIEDKANGPSVIETLKIDPDMPPIIAISPGSDSKFARAASAQPTHEAGDLAIPRVAPWVDDYTHELSVFPNGSTDDYVDTTSQYVLWARGSSDLSRLKAMCDMS